MGALSKEGGGGGGGILTHILLGVSSDKHMKLLLFSVVILGIPGGALLHRSLPTDGDLCVGLLLHPLLGVAAGADDQPDEVVARVGRLGNEDLPVLLGWAVVVGRPVGGVILDQLLDQLAPPVHQLVLAPHLCKQAGRVKNHVSANEPAEGGGGGGGFMNLPLLFTGSR